MALSLQDSKIKIAEALIQIYNWENTPENVAENIHDWHTVTTPTGTGLSVLAVSWFLIPSEQYEPLSILLNQ